MYSDILKATGKYQDHEVQLFEKHIMVRLVAKGEKLLHKGTVAKSMYYLLEGAVFQYDTDSELEHHVLDLHIKGEWFFNYESLIGQRPSPVHVEAYGDSQILEVSLKTVHDLTQKSIAFLQLNKVLEGALTRLQFFDQNMSPTEKYNHILTHRPGLIQAFPLKLIASYLKVTPETLSRVRKAITEHSRS